MQMTMNKIFRKTLIGMAAGAMAVTSCNVMDLDPTGWYGEDVAYSSVENLDLYVKDRKSVV